MNLRLYLPAPDFTAFGLHPMDYMKAIGVSWEIAVPVPLADSWWFCGCRNVPVPLPDCLSVSKLTAEAITTFGDAYYTIQQ